MFSVTITLIKFLLHKTLSDSLSLVLELNLLLRRQQIWQNIINLHLSTRSTSLGSEQMFSSLYTSRVFSSVQLLSCVLFVTPWTAARQASMSITNSWSLLKLMSIESVMPSKHLILHLPLLLPSIFPSIRVFSNEPVLCIRWLKYWSFKFSISPSNEYSGLISFRMDWLDLLAVQGTLKSLLQHHSSKFLKNFINSLALSFLYSPTLTSIHDYWKNHSID